MRCFRNGMKRSGMPNGGICIRPLKNYAPSPGFPVLVHNKGRRSARVDLTGMHPTLANRFEYRLQHALTAERNNHSILRQLANLDTQYLAFLNPVVVMHSILGINERAGGDRVRVGEDLHSVREFDALRWQLLLRLTDPRNSRIEFTINHGILRGPRRPSVCPQ